MPEFRDFMGQWRFERQITDALNPQGGRVVGDCVFRLDGQALWHVERGEMQLGAAVFEAERRYIWREAVGLIDVFFDDERYFHSFDPAQERPKAYHDCPPDAYHVTYDFAQWPMWSARWAVKGPRKDYVSQTRFEPL